MWLFPFVFLKALFLCVYCVTPNFIVILTDDQDLLLNSVVYMQKTLALIANEGKTFQNSFVNSPVCCPSRSTILTGKYAHNHRVVNNSISGNCSSNYWQLNHEPFTFTALLKDIKNYTTFYAGKYLNQYGDKKTGGTKHIPRGYDWWIGLQGNSKYYNYTLSVNGTSVFYKNDYLTDVLSNFALDFLNQNLVKENPFLMIIAPPASHAPFTPAPRHGGEFTNVTALRTPSFNYTSPDKHWLVRMPPNSLPTNVSILDDIQRRRLQTLLSVDELVENLIRKLQSLQLLENTYVIFTSDNGFHIGQFTQPWDKRQPYETDIRVPFLIRGPNIPKKMLDNYPISAVDVAPTILNLANVTVPNFMDGTSFKDRLFAQHNAIKLPPKYILIEYWGEGNKNSIDNMCPWAYDKNLSECSRDSWCKCQDSRNNTYSCIVQFFYNENAKFCQFEDNEKFIEIYDIQDDPYELHNLYSNSSHEYIQKYMYALEKLRKCSGFECSSKYISQYL